jgi:hypothetical protein
VLFCVGQTGQSLNIRCKDNVRYSEELGLAARPKIETPICKWQITQETGLLINIKENFCMYIFKYRAHGSIVS